VCSSVGEPTTYTYWLRHNGAPTFWSYNEPLKRTNLVEDCFVSIGSRIFRHVLDSNVEQGPDGESEHDDGYHGDDDEDPCYPRIG
jgi:hypothetical protein